MELHRLEFFQGQLKSIVHPLPLEFIRDSYQIYHVIMYFFVLLELYEQLVLLNLISRVHQHLELLKLSPNVQTLVLAVIIYLSP